MADEFSYGLKKLLIWKVDANGYHAGVVADPDDVDTSSGSVLSGALVRDDPVEVARPDVTRSIFTERSGQQIKQKVDAGVEEFSEFALTVARHSSALNAQANNAQTNTSRWQGVTLGGKNVTADILNTLGFSYITNSSVKSAAGFTPGKYRSGMYPSGTLAPLADGANQESGENPQNTEYTFAPARALKFPTGESLASLNLGFDETGAIYVPLGDMSDQYHIVTIWLDGTTDPVTLPYKPLYTDVTASGRNMIAKNGVASGTAITSINTSTGAVVPAANSDGDIVVLVYPTAFVPTS